MAQTHAEATVRTWMDRIKEAQRREKDYRKLGQEVVKLFEGDSSTDNSFNILFSNTETLSPALYNSLPRPDVKRRFKDADPLGKQAAELVERGLAFLLDSDLREFPSVDTLLSDAVQNALVPGRGVTRFRYEAAQGSVPEMVYGETVPWNRFLHGWARSWQKVPWVAFEWPMTEAELKENFGVTGGELVDLEGAGSSEEAPNRAEESTGAKGAWVYEIWDKSSRKVYFLSESFPDKILRETKDPFGLSGFFPCPEPLTFVQRLTSLLPVPLYTFYQEQAKELNRVTVRINRIIVALKVRGAYDSSVEGIERVLEAEDNALVPVENVASMQQGQTLEKAIFLLPIEKLIAVLQQLYLQRTQVKQVIYEITGIADIMRGNTAASETLGAQQIKSQWGSLRIKRSQKAVAQYARGCLRIMAEIMVTRFSPETFAAMTGLSFPREMQKQSAQAALQQFAVAQQPPPPELMELLRQPSWEELLGLLRQDTLRSYRIDIETNSTVDLEATEDKEDMAELMNAIAQFMNGVAPAVQAGVMPFEAAKAMLLGIVRRFRFGADVEELLEQMQPPQPPEPEGEDPAAAAEAQAKAQAAVAQEQARQQTLQMDMQFRQAEHQFKMQELQQKAALAQATFQLKAQQLQLEVQAKAAAAQVEATKPKPPAKSAGIKKQ